MGACFSAATGGGAELLEDADGGLEEFHGRFLEDRVLGEGEFGVVKLVRDMRGSGGGSDDFACKTLRKGVVFKDNTLYAPLKPEILRGEVRMLRALNGEHFCLGLRAVYETPRLIWVVTELCRGGELIDYVANQTGVQTQDVSRMAFQMLDAIAHCARHHIIHRDIKPQNVMFLHDGPGSELRLIDFGSGTHKPLASPEVDAKSATVGKEDEGAPPSLPLHHTTFAGSAFYISPEMFQRSYTNRTDVWSVGVTLYVLVAGYPADVLQVAFDKMQTSSKTRDLKSLPNMPDDMPESFYDLLEKMLVYRHKQRPPAKELLAHPFLQLHRETLSLDDVANEAKAGEPVGKSLRASVGRHSLFLDYRKFERSLTTLLATLLQKSELLELLAAMQTQLDTAQAKKEAEMTLEEDAPKDGDKPQQTTLQLDILRVHELKSLLETQKRTEVLETIDQLPNSSLYNNYAYHIALLKEFARSGDGDHRRLSTSSQRSGAGARRRRASAKINRSLRGSFRIGRNKSLTGRNLDTSVHSAGHNASQRSAAGGVYKEWVAQGLIPDKKAPTETGSVA